MRNIALTLRYLGTAYHGWQVQKNDITVGQTLEKAAANIRDYHEQMLVKTWEWKRSAGEILGQTVRGLARVGIYVPGGTAAYPSSVLMNAIPAKVAGVGELIMVTPPTENMSNEVLAAAKIAGVDTVIAIGGTLDYVVPDIDR